MWVELDLNIVTIRAGLQVSILFGLHALYGSCFRSTIAPLRSVRRSLAYCPTARGSVVALRIERNCAVEMDALHLPRNACDKIITLKEIA